MPAGEKKGASLEHCPLQEVGCKKVQEVVGGMKETNEAIIAQGKAMASLETGFGEFKDDVREDLGTIKTALLGNGREGLCDRVTRVEGKAKFSVWFAYLIISASFVAAIGVIISHVVKG